MNFDWNELAFKSKKPLNELKATFIAAPRELSTDRFKELVKANLKHGHILVGLAKEAYVEGFEDQPQFRMLQQKQIQATIDQINAAKLPYKVHTLSYFQRELPYILQKLNVREVLLVRGSWQHSFHTRPEYYILVDRKIPYQLISPFTGEAEARAYERRIKRSFVDRLVPQVADDLSEVHMLELVHKVAKFSYDYGFQTGAVLGRRTSPRSKNYYFETFAFNKVVPFQTYAMHYGATREENFTPPNDLAYYDTIHAEVKLLINAQRKQVDLKGTTLFINLMPCPTCSRMLADTDIAEVVYSIDHSDGYAIKMLEAAGKKVRRVVL